jgi:hypothetical protein
VLVAALVLFALIVGALSIFRAQGYARSGGASASPRPEQELVAARDAYAKWLAGGNRPSGFAYVGSIGRFWRAYIPTWAPGPRRDSLPIGNHILLGVVGLAVTTEYGLKGAYENTVGRLSESAMPPGGTDEDRFSAQIARRYADLVARRPWYEFGFWNALRDLWTTVPASGPGAARKWERRFALSVEYATKGVAAALAGLTTR